MIEALTASVIVTGVGMCVIDELEATPESGGVPAKMRVCLLVPGNIAWDSCECGQFAQTIQSDYPTLNFPADASDQILGIGGCVVGPLAIQVLASITRCVPTLDASGNPPTCAKLRAAALVMQGDAYALRRGITCCLETLRKNRTITKYVVGRVNYVGPEGACAGVELVYRFELI